MKKERPASVRDVLLYTRTIFVRFMKPVTLLDSKAFALTVQRLCSQLVEQHADLADTVLLGIQPRGVLLSRRLRSHLEKRTNSVLEYGELDITFHRDDIRRRDSLPTPSETNIDISLEGKKVVLVDDVLYTGRTIRAGLDALLSYGRPASVELLVLIDRRFSRELPIQPDHVGKWVDSIDEQRVAVEWKEVEGEDKVLLLA